MPGVLTWLRYSGFVVLYPTGTQGPPSSTANCVTLPSQGWRASLPSS